MFDDNWSTITTNVLGSIVAICFAASLVTILIKCACCRKAKRTHAGVPEKILMTSNSVEPFHIESQNAETVDEKKSEASGRGKMAKKSKSRTDSALESRSRKDDSFLIKKSERSFIRGRAQPYKFVKANKQDLLDNMETTPPNELQTQPKAVSLAPPSAAASFGTPPGQLPVPLGYLDVVDLVEKKSARSRLSIVGGPRKSIRSTSVIQNLNANTKKSTPTKKTAPIPLPTKASPLPGLGVQLKKTTSTPSKPPSPSSLSRPSQSISIATKSVVPSTGSKGSKTPNKSPKEPQEQPKR